MALITWHCLAAHSISVAVLGVLLVAVLCFFFVGDVFLKLVLGDRAAFDTLAFRLFSGLLISLALLYVAALAFPFGLPIDAVAICSLSFLSWAFVRRSGWRASFTGGSRAETLFLALGLLAVTLWCRELLQPIDSSQSVTVIRAWQDVYYHLSQITEFAKSKGASTIHDVQMAGVSVRPYHFASYVLPAWLVSASGVSAWTAYASVLVPVGLLLTFLAAQAIAAPLFGVWPAGVAALALLLLPDASQLGFGNPFMSYHWLQQIAPAGGYGIACAAMSFLMVIEACRRAEIRLIVFSYVFLFLTIFFKAQIFVAVAFLVFVFPALFFPRLSIWLRAVSVSVMAILFVGVVRFSQQLSGVPVLRLDGSGLPAFSQLILGNQAPGILRDFFNAAFSFSNSHLVLFGTIFGFMLLLVTFGIFPVVYACQLRRLQARFAPVVWTFPILIVGNFLVMATGLALDDRRIGAPEELLHRPFVMAYFVMVVWMSASLYQLRFGDAPPTKRAAAWSAAVVAMLLAIVPGYFGHRIQTMPSWGIGDQELSSCLVRTAAFLTANSQPGDVVQAADNDPKFAFSAFSQREPYVIDAGGIRAPMGSTERLQTLASLRSAATLPEASAAGKRLGIQWWVSVPGVQTVWSADAAPQAAFACDGYQAFRF